MSLLMGFWVCCPVAELGGRAVSRQVIIEAQISQQGCVTRTLQGDYTDTTLTLQGRHKDVTRM
jgi:hypothetical protein